MCLNLNRADQIVRFLLGAALILLAGLGVVDGVLKIAAVAFGSVAVFTASAGYCPIYRLLGRTRCNG